MSLLLEKSDRIALIAGSKLEATIEALEHGALRDHVQGNLQTELPSGASMAEIIWFDVRESTPVLSGEPLRETAASELAIIIGQNYQRGKSPFDVASKLVLEALVTLAHRHEVDAVQDYLQALKWDGRDRFESQLPAAFGFDTANERRFRLEVEQLRRFMISAVARARVPGCKVDCALVLKGPQGFFKSTAVKALFGDDLVHESSMDITSKDAFMVMNRAWCVEWAELTALTGKTAESVKHFLSIQRDTYRPPYGRVVVTFPRRAVICGTTNDDDFLVDPTGNRRFWVCGVERMTEHKWIRSQRDQLWAQAVDLFERGERWHLGERDASEQAELVEEYRDSDEWEQLIVEWLRKHPAYNPVTVAQVLEGAFNLKPINQSQKDQKRAVRALKRAGWVKRHTSGGNVYVPHVPTAEPSMNREPTHNGSSINQHSESANEPLNRLNRHSHNDEGKGGVGEDGEARFIGSPDSPSEVTP